MQCSENLKFFTEKITSQYTKDQLTGDFVVLR